MAKPTTLPEWASSGLKITPSSGKQQNGWNVGEIPPAQFENWRANLVYDWLNWLDDHTDATRTLIVPASDGIIQISGNGWLFQETLWDGSGGVAGDRVFFPLNLEIGAVLKTVRGYVKDTNGANGTLQVVVARAAQTTGSGSTIASSSVSAADGTAQTLTVDCSSHAIVTGYSYYAYVVAGAGASTTDQIYNLQVDYVDSDLG